MAQDSETTFQSTFLPSEEKSSEKYILQFAKDIWKEAQDSKTAFSFESNAERFKTNRKYSEGLNSIEKFKQRFSVDGDDTFLNIDWNVSTPLPKIIEVMRGMMINQPFKADFKPTDSLSVSDVEKKRRMLLAKMEAKKVLGDLEQQGLINVSKDNIPEDKEAVDVYMATEFKLGQSIAMEALSKAILEDNDFEYTQSKIAKDLIDNKISGVRIELDSDNNICIRAIDPVNLVTSFVRKDDFSDAKFIGEIDRITIDDLRVQADLSEDELFQIAKSYSGKENNSEFPYSDRYYNQDVDNKKYGKFLVKVLDFEFFSTDDLVYVKQEAKNGGYYFQKKESDYEVPKNAKRKRTVNKKRVKNIYCGKWVIGSDTIYNYGKKKNIIRKRQNNRMSLNTQLGFIIYAPDILDMRNKSKVEEAIPYAESLILIQLKIQQTIAKAAPSGYLINVDAVTEAMVGMGMGNMTPVDMRSLVDQTGDFYYKERLQDGTPIATSGHPITPKPSGLDSSLQILGVEYNMALQRMKETLGMNDAVDSSQPDKRAAVGVQKISLAAHKNALRTLYNAYLKINEETVRYVTLLSQQLIRKGVNVKKYENWIGEDAIKLIDMGKLPFYDYAINIKMLPDDEEKQAINEQLMISVQAGTLKSEDVFAVRRLMDEDTDKAELLLSHREKKRLKEAQEQAAQQSQMNAEAQAQAAQAAEQAKQQTLQLQAQIDEKLLIAKYDREERLIQIQGEEDRKTEVVKGDVKEELIETAADVENNPPLNSTSKPPTRKLMDNSTEESNGGYDIKNDSIPKEAGKVEPSLGASAPRVEI